MDLFIWAIIGALLLAGICLVCHQFLLIRVPKMPLSEPEATDISSWEWSSLLATRVAPVTSSGMTLDDLQTSLRSKFSFLGVAVQNPSEKLESGEMLEHWAIPCFDEINGSTMRAWVHYYIKATGEVTWQEREPKSPPSVPILSFAQKLELARQAKIADGTLRYASIDNVDEVGRRSLITAILADKTTRKIVVSADAQDKFTFEVI